MSIAELIMQGTEQASKSTDWVADSLAKLGDSVSKSLRDREQQKQAQEMLPFLQQNLQAAMIDAQNGKPGQAYSKLLGSLDTQTLNNPQLAGFVKLGFSAIGQTTDARISSQRTSGGGMENMLPILAMTNPQLAANLASQIQANKQDYTTGDEFVEPALPQNGGMEPRLNPEGGSLNAPYTPPSAVATPDQVGQTEQVKPISQTQVKAAEAFGTVSQKVEGAISSEKPISSIVAESTKMVFPAEDLKQHAKTFRRITGLDKYIPGAEGIVELQSPSTLRQNNFNVSSKGGASISFENIDDQYNYEKERVPFQKNITEQISILNADDNIQKAIKIFGGIENVAFSNDASGKTIVKYTENGKQLKIPIRDSSRKALEYLLGVPQAAKDAMMPLYGTEMEMPAVGSKIDVKSLEGKIGTDPKTGKQFKIVNGQPVPL